MKKAPLSFILARILIGLSIVVGFFTLPDIELFSGTGLFLIAVQGFLLFTLVCLFSEPNLGRLLTFAVFIINGLLAAVAAIAGSAFGLPIYLVIIDMLLATVQLTLAWHLLAGAPARQYAAKEPSDARA